MKELDDLHAAQAALDLAREKCLHEELDYKLVCNARVYVWCKNCLKSIGGLEFGPGDIDDEFAKRYVQECYKRSRPNASSST